MLPLLLLCLALVAEGYILRKLFRRLKTTPLLNKAKSILIAAPALLLVGIAFSLVHAFWLY